jgi:hypothetical protein
LRSSNRETATGSYKMKTCTENIILGTGLMAFFCYVLFVLIPEEIFVPAGIQFRALSPAFFPKLTSALLIGLGGLLVVRSLVERKVLQAANPATSPGGEADNEEDNSLDYPLPIKAVKIGAAVFLLFSYYWLIGIFGMLATSIFMMPLFAFLYGSRNWKLVLPLSIVLAVSLYYFFGKVASISIPKGSLFG